ncbi:PREDICTED: uncharacterized protein LOC106308983 [Brassica oleracea var. oleracea]|uniref:uncharacterized protein LOC106308983 n=1 Tax=Brassica oleracea var. oleracea TaxID=109376 RepID=UPI0006A6B28A|nr:PREDICTED: uncharacterized protein LOC106308983 [Brassica oleracea var. oleracea]
MTKDLQSRGGIQVGNCQQNVVFRNGSDGVSLSESEAPFLGSQGIREKRGANTKAIRKEIRTWTPTDDVVLISSWLNTSKDPIVGNEQRSTAFWKRIAGYYNASPKLDGCEKREAAHCKNRWHKINDIVCKFCGAYEAANREKTSGKNENDFLKLAHEIFFTNHNKKFTLEQLGKNCVMTRSGAAKARGKKTMVEGKDLDAFETMWSIKQQDLKIKERLLKMKILDSLIAKQKLLADYEEALKKQLIIELMSNYMKSIKSLF